MNDARLTAPRCAWPRPWPTTTDHQPVVGHRVLRLLRRRDVLCDQPLKLDTPQLTVTPSVIRCPEFVVISRSTYAPYHPR